ncbi:ABC transporter ATP-binding protein [Halobacillus sp. ACCC02827]|uniref:ABC transporter ATP-binding protein n=1 Tax=Bacillaceae TaxID=186817 RepID=UPI0002A4F4B3|nr:MULTISPECIES: ABC transporter ATP-binding protein [Bacillaceae]ELK47619.1 ABC-type transport system ATP-binding protein [Halobacillus sp. BAB-2008]QHT45931.1 ABC transporter ATP-binding protein [Bacillus sp. SB49]WJE16741.1 ABC transporter ATP-binding protein [Halobacillus sp. ACCC02827]
MIEINRISKSFAGKQAVRELDLSIPDGKIFGFLGPNGAGKSTTIKMMTGILPIDDGSITLNGVDISKDPMKAKRLFGYVPDRSDIFLRLKGIEYLNFIADIFEVPEDLRRRRIDELTKSFGIYDALNDHIQTYSHGMKQKIVVTGVLLHDPDVWILDEPLTGLDPKSAYTLKELMRDHAARGKIVFFSTHVLEVVEQLCDEVAIIHNGHVQFQGNMTEMRQQFKEDDNLERLFLELTENE